VCGSIGGDKNSDESSDSVGRGRFAYRELGDFLCLRKGNFSHLNIKSGALAENIK
jgi:hypothetical protein